VSLLRFGQNRVLWWTVTVAYVVTSLMYLEVLVPVTERKVSFVFIVVVVKFSWKLWQKQRLSSQILSTLLVLCSFGFLMSIYLWLLLRVGLPKLWC